MRKTRPDGPEPLRAARASWRRARRRRAATQAVALLASIALSTSWAFPTVSHAREPDVRCQVKKTIEAGRYVLCRSRAIAKGTKKAVAPDFATCDARFDQRWAKHEAKGAGACPTDGDGAAIRALAASLTDEIAIALALPASPQTPDSPGDLVITEIMRNPDAVPDEDGEWFELRNDTPTSLELQGLVLRDQGTNSFAIADSLIVPPGGFVVLGRNGDPALNGGYVPDVVWDGLDFQLGNTTDEIEVVSGSTVIDSVAYDAGSWPDTRGAAMSLSPSSTDESANDDPTSWCDAAAPYGAGDRGTPGQSNPSCP